MDEQDVNVKDTREYELAVLVPNEDDLVPVVALVRQHGGEIATEPRAKKLALAYEIKKHKEAVFAYLTFKGPQDEAKNLEHDLQTAAVVLRSMIIASPAPVSVTSERPMISGTPGVAPRRTVRLVRPAASDARPSAPAIPKTLSNEALEKKIEEILQ